MGRSVRPLSAFIAGTLVFAVGTPLAHAVLKKDQQRCVARIAKEGGLYITKKLKAFQKCRDADLAAPGTCTAPDPLELQELADELLAGLAEKCRFDSIAPDQDDDNLAQIGFPGSCVDANPGDGFTLPDLQDCILTSHDKIFTGVCRGGSNLGEACTVVADCPDSGPDTFCHGLFPVEYDPSVTGPLAGTQLKCQRNVGRSAAKFTAKVLKSVQKCRNALLNCRIVSGPLEDTTVCQLDGLTGASCKTNDPRTKRAVDNARAKAIAAIASKCDNAADVVDLKLCDPDQITPAAAAACIIEIHEALTDNPDPGDANDLIDYEYAQRGVCGDNRLNQPNEECDGAADTQCPGLCGGADGYFPCLCQNVRRTRVVEHANADLDNGWSGLSHDSGIVEGGGYVTDVWDCDGPLGPDTECVVGPSCALPPHQPCNPARDATGNAANADLICNNGPGDFCRKTRGGSTGPHCELDFKKRCKRDLPDCPTPGDRCVTVQHGAPLPLSSGGVPVCIVNVFTEDVTGTTDLATGASSIRLRQNSTTYKGGDLQQPCPVCGGFCSGPGGPTDPGVRNLCTTNADCAPGSTCITAPICSWGPDIDQKCRPNPPGGGPTEFFGNPSVDCRMNGDLFGTINILFNPATTGSTSLTANLPCNSPGFTNKVCAGGPNQHAVCTVDSECPGGTCNHQCFCPNGVDESQRPNACQAACVGGADDAQPCATNGDCGAPGFCHPGDCRLNPSDNDSIQEGQCTVGPFDSFCSLQRFKPCGSDLACRPPSVGGSCSFCDPSETCQSVPRDCFVNPTIIRAGAPGVPERKTAAIFCIQSTTASAVNSVAGLPGPGAITQPAKTIEVGF